MAKTKGGDPFGGAPAPSSPPSGGSSSSSGGSSGGSTKKTPPKPGSPGGKDYYYNYLEYALGIGLPPSADITSLARRAADNRWSSAIFLHFLRQTAAYRQAFPGIFRMDGSLRFSEAQYNALYSSYTDIARQAGVQFDKDRFAFALRHGIGGNEFQARATAIQRVKENELVFHQFEQTLRARGLLKGDLKRSDLYDFVMGKGPFMWNKVWEEASLRSTAAESGLRIGADITRKELLRLAHQAPGFQAEGDYASQFAQLAQNIRSIIPEAHLVNQGISRRDLYVLEFGGKSGGRTQAQIGEQAQRIYDTWQASLEPTATPQLVPTGTGSTLLGSQEQRPQTQ